MKGLRADYTHHHEKNISQDKVVGDCHYLHLPSIGHFGTYTMPLD